MKITDALVCRLEELSKLRLTEDQKEKTKQELQNILSCMDALNELNTDSVEPMSHVAALQNVFRADEVQPSADREEILSGASRKKDGCFTVPHTFE